MGRKRGIAGIFTAGLVDSFLKSCARSLTIQSAIPKGCEKTCKEEEKEEERETALLYKKLFAKIFGSKFLVYSEIFKKGQTMTKPELKEWIKAEFFYPKFLEIKQTEGGYMLTYLITEVYIKKIK